MLKTPSAKTAPQRLPASPSEVIDRGKSLEFRFDGTVYRAFPGDTIASALAAAGVSTISRSFKYHRRRGPLCMSGDCPNCLVQVGDEPNVRACRRRVEDGMAVRSQNAWPSLDRDLLNLTERFERFLPVGFYYKAFMRPQAMWPLYETILRNAAGLGEVDPDSTPGGFDEVHLHTQVLVVGGGPAGLRAALSAASLGAQVTLVDENPALGGHLRYRGTLAEGIPGYRYAGDLADQVSGRENVSVLTDTTAFGWYEDNWVGAVQGDRLVKIRGEAAVLATGARQIPSIFENNDLPGIMLSDAALRLVHLWGVRPGERAVILSASRLGLEAALELDEAGVQVAAVAEMRAHPEVDLSAELRQRGIEVLTEMRASQAHGRERVKAVELTPRDGGPENRDAPAGHLYCDLLLLATGLAPANNLLYQAGGRFQWDAKLRQFTPLSLPETIFAAGGVAGTHLRENAELEGELAGLQAAFQVGLGGEAEQGRVRQLKKEVEGRRREREAWSAPPLAGQKGKHRFVCLCEDVTTGDMRQSIREGYASAELLKRYTAVSMGPCQGKMCNRAAMYLGAMENDRTVAETGTTTSRPPVRPVTLGALAGRLMQPVRETPMGAWHRAHGAKMMVAGEWMRPEHYDDPTQEARAVRERVGLIDVSTLGKIHIHGPDAVALLERVYTNCWARLQVGRARYGLMVNEEGVVFDDGITARLGEDFYYMTTTSGGARGVYEWIEWWLQSGWELDVHTVQATELRAAMNLAGPRARDTLSRLVEGVDLSNEAFPYMHARQGYVAGAPALLLRIGFTGELGYEIHVPSGYGLQVWEALLEAGGDYGIQPFGIEAQRVLRLEKGHLIVGQDTDSLSNPLEAGAKWAVKLAKEDFLGKPSLVRLAERGIAKRLVGFEMVDGALPEEANQIVRPGDGPTGLEIIGRVTSARYSRTLDKVIGLCWLPEGMATPGTAFSVRTRGDLQTGRVAKLPFYDPEGKRTRS